MRLPPWAAVFGLVLACAWGNNQFTPLMVLYRERYSELAVNLFLAVSVLGLTVSLLGSGPLSERRGRRPVTVAGALAAILASGGLALSATGAAAICVGRLFAGLAIGTAMAVGTTWLKELSQPPHDLRAHADAGARRASVAFTAGSALGALAAGALAQWAPLGAQLPFLLHIALMLPLTWLALRAPETGEAVATHREVGWEKCPRRLRPRPLARPARRTLARSRAAAGAVAVRRRGDRLRLPAAAAGGRDRRLRPRLRRPAGGADARHGGARAAADETAAPAWRTPGRVGGAGDRRGRAARGRGDGRGAVAAARGRRRGRARRRPRRRAGLLPAGAAARRRRPTASPR